jgi:Protein of unknown function, DUF547
MRTTTSIILAAVVQLVVAQDKPTRMDHSAWDMLLRKYVTEAGVVNYAGLKTDMTFERYLASLTRFAPQEAWTADEKKAYWINAYNAFTVKLICDNLPLKSIKDIGDPWKKKFIKIGKEMMDLDRIENGILRAQFDDPRVHFALSSASVSSPVLHNRAYTAATLSAQLEVAAKRFINDPLRNNLSESKLQLSSIFNRYKADFTKGGAVVQYLQRYTDMNLMPDAAISYLDDDWGLNGS